MTEQTMTFLSHMNANVREIIEKTFEKRTFEPGQVIVNEGDRGDSMHVILKGHVEIIRATRKEDKPEVITTLTEGQALGEVSLVDGSPRNATARATKPTETLVVTRSEMDRLKAKEPAAALALYEAVILQLAARFRSVSNKKDAFAFWFS